jgi:transmembrane sensor
MDLQNPTTEELLCDESFLRYCRGENQADILFWQHWINMHPAKQPVIEKAIYLYDMLSVGQGSRMEQSAALKDAITRKEHFAVLLERPLRVVSVKKRNVLRYAAAIALLITTGTLTYFSLHKTESWALLRYEYATTENRQTIMLPDSSIVMLNANSHLSISKSYREVTISGEAFFDVKHDAAHPFIVHTYDYNIRVLGTSFNVRSYPGIKETETDLLSGKIEIVRTGSEKVTLRPNQKYHKMGIIAALHVDTVTHHVKEISWTRRKMEFNDETFVQIAKQLESWYGMKIVFAGEEVKRYRYTASFDDETIFKSLRYLQQSYPFTYKIEQDSIIISGN